MFPGFNVLRFIFLGFRVAWFGNPIQFGIEIPGLGENDFPEILQFVSGCFPALVSLRFIYLGFRAAWFGNPFQFCIKFRQFAEIAF